MEYKITKYLEQKFKGISKPVWDQFQMEHYDTSLNQDGVLDPLTEDDYKVCDCLVKRYPRKVLFLVTQFCEAHCAFCTRQRLCYSHYSIDQIHDALNHVRDDETIEDVLFSGGDPMTVPTLLASCIDFVSKIDHVKLIRIGTRLPIVCPENAMSAVAHLPQLDRPVYVNIHINHPDEVTEEAVAVFKALMKKGYLLGSQTVILKGINDDADTLRELFVKLTSVGVRPYYAYVPDKVTGTERFWVSPQRCMEIFSQLRGLSGLCIPKLVWDGPAGKIYLPEYPVITECDGSLTGIGFDGRVVTHE